MNSLANELRPRHRWTVADYHKMAKTGVLTEDSRVELIEGEVIEMAPIGSEHAGKIMRLTHLLTARLGEQALLSTQNPIRLDEHSEPQPDIALVRQRDDFYETAHPGPADVLLLIEVADRSVAYDRQVKIPLYARHGIPEVWLVDLQQHCLEIYRHPGPEGYGQVAEHRTGQIAPEKLPEITINLAELF
jgi:Uma2 family endonuclease